MLVCQLYPWLEAVTLILGKNRGGRARFRTCIEKENAIKPMPAREETVGEGRRGARAMPGVGRGEHQQRVDHQGATTQTKNPGVNRGLSLPVERSVIAAQCGKQVQQMNEQVVDAEIEPHRGADIVGLATVDDAAGIEQNQA